MIPERIGKGTGDSKKWTRGDRNELQNRVAGHGQKQTSRRAEPPAGPSGTLTVQLQISIVSVGCREMQQSTHCVTQRCKQTRARECNPVPIFQACLSRSESKNIFLNFLFRKFRDVGMSEYMSIPNTRRLSITCNEYKDRVPVLKPSQNFLQA